MVRRAKGTTGPMAKPPTPGQALNYRHFPRSFVGEGRKQPRQALRNQSLARPRGTHHEQVMPSHGSEREGPLGQHLPLNPGKGGENFRRGRFGRNRGRERRRALHPSQDRRQGRRQAPLGRGKEPRLRTIALGQYEHAPRLCCGFERRESPGDGTKRPIQRQLPEKFAVRRRRHAHPLGLQERQGYWEVKACAALGKIGRGQIDRNAALGKAMANGGQGAMDPVSKIPEGPLRGTGDLKGRQAAAKPHFHLHQGCGHAERGAAVDGTISHALGGIVGGRGAFEGI